MFALLVAGVGVGSFIQHGPHPDWQAYAHDLPLAAVLVFVAADAASDLTGRELSHRWWLIPSVAMVPVVAMGATASTIAQTVMAAAAIGGSLLRAVRRPVVRRALITALVIAAAGATVGTPSDQCRYVEPTVFSTSRDLARPWPPPPCGGWPRQSERAARRR